MYNYPTLPDRATNAERDNEKAVAVLYSGGIDSTVVVAALLAQGRKVYPIAMDDGSLNFQLRRSVAIEESLKALGIQNRLVIARVPEPEGMRISKDQFGFIPGLKMIFLTTAFAYCQVLNLKYLYTGYQEDNTVGGYIDEDLSFMEKLSDLYYETYGVEENTDFFFGQRIQLKHPLVGLTKAEVILKAKELGVDLSTTISCRQVRVGAGLIHCGKCRVCARRKAGFVEAREVNKNIIDPTLWHSDPTQSEIYRSGKL